MWPAYSHSIFVDGAGAVPAGGCLGYAALMNTRWPDGNSPTEQTVCLHLNHGWRVRFDCLKRQSMTGTHKLREAKPRVYRECLETCHCWTTSRRLPIGVRPVCRASVQFPRTVVSEVTYNPVFKEVARHCRQGYPGAPAAFAGRYYGQRIYAGAA
jgi:hypothetical protein